MKPSEAARLVAVLAAYWPGTDVRDETAQLWENELLPFEITDGMEAARLFGRSGMFMPSLAEFLDGIRECRNDRLREERAALPPPRASEEYISLTEYLHRNPEKIPIVENFQGSWVGAVFARILQGEIDEAQRRKAREART